MNRAAAPIVALDLPSGIDADTGRVLGVEQESEATLAAGAPIMEIGNVEGDLEVLVEQDLINH